MPRGTIQDCCYQCLHACGEPLPTHASTEDSLTLAGSFGSVSCGFAAPLLWVLVYKRFCLCPPRLEFLFPQSYGGPIIKFHWPSRSDSLGIPSPFVRFPRLESLIWGSEPPQVGEPLWYNCSPVSGLPPWWVWDLILLGLCPSLCRGFFVFGCGYRFLVCSSVLLLIVVEQLVAILVLLQEEMSARPSTPPSWTGTPDFFFKKSSSYTTQGCFFVIYLFSLLLRLFCICSKWGLDAVHGLLLFWRTGTWSSVVMTHRLSCSKTCGISLDQGLNPCLLHWQADSLSLSHKGKPSGMLLISFTNCISPQLYWGKIDRNCIHARYTVWYLGVCLHYEKIPTVKLINISIISHS